MATFTWPCPTFGCRGFITLENQPGLNTIATCESPFDEDKPFCGREMRWSVVENAWVPIGPFGFQ